MSQQDRARLDRVHEAAELAAAEGGTAMEDFLQAYYRHVATEDILQWSPGDLLSMALSHKDLARSRPSGTANVTCVNPSVENDGWSSPHTVIQIVTDDMPFLVDSVLARLTELDRSTYALIHPQIRVRRDATGELLEILPSGPTERESSGGFGEISESWINVEIARDSNEQSRRAVADALRAVLSDVREAVEDWPKMQQRARALASTLRGDPPAGVTADELTQATDLLTWLADNHFTFLGCRDYALVETDQGTVLQPVTGTGLGLLRSDPLLARERVPLTGRALAKARDQRLLFVTKANSRATVHRAIYLDYIGVKTFADDGTVTGEHRFLGLFTQSAYTESVLRVPYLRDKVAQIMARSGFAPESHSGKDLLGILETYPRDELFQAGVDDLYDVTLRVLHLQEKRTTKMFLRSDDFGRFVSCIVFIPRDRYNTAVRLKMEEILRDAFNATSIDYTTRVSESVLARIHFVVRVPPGHDTPRVDEHRLEARIVDATRSWDEDFVEAALREFGEEETGRLAESYQHSFPTAYKEDFDVRQGVADVRHLEDLPEASSTRLVLYKPRFNPETMRRFKLFRRSPLSLTEVLPLFTHMGVEVVDERPYAITRADGQLLHVYDFGLRVRDDKLWGSMTHARLRELFEAAVAAVWSGEAESDGFNALVLRAQLTWRQVVVLRTIARYLRQTHATFSPGYLETALLNNWRIAAQLVALFETRFDPAAPPDGRAEREDAIAADIIERLDAVSSLDEDRIIRAFLGVIRATLRTNFFQNGDRPKSYVSLKLDPSKVPDLPAPRPAYEIWVYSPRVEGVHLRFGPVARGGLRWSDRREDFRTEILGLVKAQVVKNAVIVPTGSKGGFFAKQLPDPTLDRQAWLDEGIAAYRLFISGLLDLTDNRLGGDVVPPRDVVRHDGDDPYLVVAADKGTATFSDIANGVSQDYGFWLDDAFASGGSSGYDHKAMGITARGAWESVKRHFRELGVDTQTEDFTVVGVGDMSGDVFGNGMLLSEHIRLVAAFDHRHVFVDPTPDPATSYAERARLFALPRSSWADYDPAIVSAGGGVFARSLKAIPVTEQMIAALGLPAGTTSMTPAELIHAILLAPVDLLWNGGIGTYVKASSEGNDQVGDRANDAIRVNGDQLRVKVIGEGGNLGLTQLGRVQAAISGVLVNTDAIDNSAGVDTSDHEVNIKILLGQVVRDGDLTLKQRNVVLASMTDDVAAAVLRDNNEQNVLLGNARAQEHAMITVHRRLIHWLEDRHELDRALEYLPSDAEIAERAAAGLGLKSPEFSVLVAYAKLALKKDLLPTGLPDDPWFQATLRDYFPPAIRNGFADALAQHPLRREIITNAVANSIINRGGITFVFRAMEETGATAEQVARAFVIAREVFNLADYVGAVEALDNVVSTKVQTQLYLEFRRLLDRVVRWFLSSRPAALDVASEVDRFAGNVASWGPRVAEHLRGEERTRLSHRIDSYVQAGVPEDLATRAAGLLDSFSLLDITEICVDRGAEPAEVVPLYFYLSEQFGVDALLGKITRLPREDRWDALARGALRDDLYAVLEGITAGVIETTPDKAATDPAGRYAAWARQHDEALQRTKRSLTGIERLEPPTIAALSVGLRTLRAMVRTGAVE